MALNPGAQRIAEEHAARDRDTLARLVREGRVVRRDGEFEQRHPDVAQPFVADIMRRVRPRPAVNPTIRPKAKRRRR